MYLNIFRKNPFVLLLPLLFSLSCNKSQENKVAKQDILRYNMDSTVNPGDNFFMYANGNWVKAHPIPPSESSWSIGREVKDEIYARLRKISEEAAKEQAAPGTAAQKIGDFFHAGMDTVSINKNGLTPLLPQLNMIDRIKSLQDILDVMAYQKTYFITSGFGAYVGQDDMNSDKMVLFLYQSGLNLPNRDYYFNSDSRTRNIRNEYLKHISRILVLSGEDSVAAAKKSQKIMRLETALAKKSRKLEDLRDPYANYHKMAVSELSRKNSNIPWSDMLTKMEIKNVDTVVVGQPEFLEELNRLLRSEEIETWKAYLKWCLINENASYLNKEIDDEHFHFYGAVMSGMKKHRDRWKRVLDQEEDAMGELLGQLFVKDYFPVKTKERYEKLVGNVMDAYRQHIKMLDWMSDSTKQKALAKLNKIKKKVGFPDKWKDFSSLEIDKSSYVINCLRANNFWYHYNINKLGKPVDRTEWEMTPQTYNAYYYAANNEIVLSAAIFAIPGLKDEEADDAIIYGYTGASTIGHELTHGFDDQGRQYDEKGNLNQWWTKKDEETFNKKVNLIVRQFNEFKVLDSMTVNGKASAGENIADLGGLVIGFDAFKKTEQYKKGKKIAGLTPTQRFFMGYALGWRTTQRDEALARQILTDVHAPAYLRVNGPMANIPEFYEAFNVKPGQPMWRPDSLRVKIW